MGYIAGSSVGLCPGGVARIKRTEIRDGEVAHSVEVSLRGECL